jgi:hypothetical protein
VNDLFIEQLVEAFQVRNVHRAHGSDRRIQGFVGTTVSSEGLSRGPQGSEYLRPIESLAFTMVAETHRVPPFG